MRHHSISVAILFGIIFLSPFSTASTAAQDNVCEGPFIPVSQPLTDLGSEEYVRLEGGPTGFTGGLYPGGSNRRPPAHDAYGIEMASQIRPLNSAGNPAPNGRIVMISVGMSNASSEFNGFISAAHEDPEVNPALKLINGAQGGRVSNRWLDPDAETWHEVNRRLNRYDATPQQVQVAWVKQVRTKGGDFPAKAELLQSDLETIARNLKIHYPNLKIAYFSSRTRSYTYWRGLSPEPVAFESGFSVKWMIEKQIAGDPSLNFYPSRGDVNVPYLSWGPYLWIDGLNERSDGRVWTPEDLARDCTHPSQQGNQKVVDMMMAFFKSDTTATGWFLAQPPNTNIMIPTATAIPPTGVPPTDEATRPAETTGASPAAQPSETNTPSPPEGVAIVPSPASQSATPASPAESTGRAASLPLATALILLVAAGVLGWAIARRR